MPLALDSPDVSDYHITISGTGTDKYPGVIRNI